MCTQWHMPNKSNGAHTPAHPNVFGVHRGETDGHHRTTSTAERDTRPGNVIQFLSAVRRHQYYLTYADELACGWTPPNHHICVHTSGNICVGGKCYRTYRYVYMDRACSSRILDVVGTCLLVHYMLRIGTRAQSSLAGQDMRVGVRACVHVCVCVCWYGIGYITCMRR